MLKNRIPPIHTVVFDVGGVLIDWNPRYLYRTIIPEEGEMERFLSEVCTPEWHAQHDLGISYEDTIPALVAAHPEWAGEITAWSDRFVEMYGGVFDGTVELLTELHRRRVPLVASTNWGAESWVTAKARYEFLECFDGALVSGEIGIAKPDAAFFELLIETFNLVPERTLYVEDNIANPPSRRGEGIRFPPLRVIGGIEDGPSSSLPDWSDDSVGAKRHLWVPDRLRPLNDWPLPAYNLPSAQN